MPYLKSDNHNAMTIHERYQMNNDQLEFLRAAREFLFREQQQQQQSIQSPQKYHTSQPIGMPTSLQSPVSNPFSTNPSSTSIPANHAATPTRQHPNRTIVSTTSPAPIGSQKGYASPSPMIPHEQFQHQELPPILRMAHANKLAHPI